ncbi:MAG: hypothetical protein COY58_08385 [Gammaproteobacteria bacterium CG_4_10_14_0_8_um_filter_38_16]|nr:MAG: hypothetical protein COY58_08385 [Gammaproteobacteria bacterium CG_4_10_14_0_8_um_filter_38_16]PJA03118.1 MAG: hypothetical protein COX72_06790 [Gammaproteobacteria bacterium CG_4_10_14_0_2_um_filter_38_22]PJB10375.1 MAG: hypothetical protein CO120_05190 [Gammaproteobacteria bacterium CG_4_9_14_3_um_filter_38_9]
MRAETTPLNSINNDNDETPKKISKKDITMATTCLLISAASVAPYLVITRDDPIINITSVIASNFLVNLYAAYEALNYLATQFMKSKPPFAGSLLFSAITSLPLTIIAHSEAKSEAAKTLIPIATFLGTSVVNALALTVILRTIKQFSTFEKERSKLLRQIDLAYLAQLEKPANEFQLKKMPKPLLIAGWSAEYALKLALIAPMTFCVLILTTATEKSFRNSLHLSSDIAFSSAFTLMSPIILLCAINGWNLGDNIATQIANYYQTNHILLDQPKKVIALMTALAVIIACRSGDAIKTLQKSACNSSLLRPVTTFPGAATAGDVSATLFNVYFCYLSLMKLYQLLIENCCQAKSTDTAQPAALVERRNARTAIMGTETKEMLSQARDEYSIFKSVTASRTEAIDITESGAEAININTNARIQA